MSDTINDSIVFEDDDFAIMPDGYGDGDDIFSPTSWGGASAADEQDRSEATESGDGADDFFGGDDPTTVGETEKQESKETEENEPTTPETKGTKHKFKATVDHVEQDVELDEADLPTIYQKAQVTDRVQAKLGKLSAIVEKAEKAAKLLGYESADEMLSASTDSYRDNEIEKLVNEGTPRRIAEDYVARTMDKPAAKAEDAPGKRDFKPEAELLLRMWPELQGKSLPDEVVNDSITTGDHLVEAYKRYVDKQAKAVKDANDAEKNALKKDNKILKQNAEAASRAPVRGVARGGATNTKADDAFLRGFLADDDY